MIKNPFEAIRSRVQCWLCERDTTGFTHVSCVDCEDQPVCLACLVHPKDQSAHKGRHQFTLRSNLRVPLYAPNWSIVDELLLVEGVEKFGFGNWQQIARHIASKTDEETEQHFAILYGRLCGRSSAARAQSGRPRDDPASDPSDRDPTEPGPAPFRKLQDRVRRRLDSAFQTAKRRSEEFGINQTDKSGYGQVIGFMPLRDEFEVEYNNDAELYLADMEFFADDTEEDTRVKHTMLSIYHSRLQERDEKKRFVIEHGLIDFHRVCERERGMSEQSGIRCGTRCPT